MALSVDKRVVICQIGAKIAYWRTLRGMTQATLARQTGLSRTTISKIECGNYNENISINHIIDIAEAMNVDFTMLIEFNAVERKMWCINANSERL